MKNLVLTLVALMSFTAIYSQSSIPQEVDGTRYFTKQNKELKKMVKNSPKIFNTSLGKITVEKVNGKLRITLHDSAAVTKSNIGMDSSVLNYLPIQIGLSKSGFVSSTNLMNYYYKPEWYSTSKEVAAYKAQEILKIVFSEIL